MPVGNITTRSHSCLYRFDAPSVPPQLLQALKSRTVSSVIGLGLTLGLAACGSQNAATSGDASSSKAATIIEVTRVAVLAEPPGLNCPTGGSKVIAGIDTDDNGTLEISEATTT
jgi:hypothetical protein